MIHLPPALRHRRFRLLWIGLAISIAGSQMQVWSLFWHIRTITEQPIALGGATYARAFNNCVAYGPLFPDELLTEHEPNERAIMENLYLAMRIYAHAIYQLTR